MSDPVRSNDADRRSPDADDLASRMDAARRLLMEAVFASRASGANAAPRAPSAPSASAPSDSATGNCGLGTGPDLDAAVLGAGAGDEARRAAARLWPDGLDASRTEAARAALRGWVKRQDGLDRTRNHFIKEFRAEHGFDRRTYSPEVLIAYEDGVEAVNQRNRDGLDAAARALLDV